MSSSGNRGSRGGQRNAGSNRGSQPATFHGYASTGYFGNRQFKGAPSTAPRHRGGPPSTTSGRGVRAAGGTPSASENAPVSSTTPSTSLSAPSGGGLLPAPKFGEHQGSGFRRQRRPLKQPTILKEIRERTPPTVVDENTATTTDSSDATQGTEATSSSGGPSSYAPGGGDLLPPPKYGLLQGSGFRSQRRPPQQHQKQEIHNESKENTPPTVIEENTVDAVGSSACTPSAEATSCASQMKESSTAAPGHNGEDLLSAPQYGAPQTSGYAGYARQSRPLRQQQRLVKPTALKSIEEETPPVVEKYTTAAIVMWVEGAYGEVICERNLKSSFVHFYFDATTEIDGTTVPLAAQSKQGLSLTPGSKIEFEASYKPLSTRESEKSMLLVHIDKITVVGKEPDFEMATVSVVSQTYQPHKPTLTMDKDGDFVLLSPLLFSKKWILECLRRTDEGDMPKYPAKKTENLLVPGRTITGKVIKSPRWFGDVMGGLNSPKNFLVSIEKKSEVRSGLATVTHVVPSQSVVLEADDFPEEPMFFLIVSLSKEDKELLEVGARVKFTACTELPGFAFKWRILETSPMDSTSARSSPASTSNPNETVIEDDGTVTEDEKLENPPVFIQRPTLSEPAPLKPHSYVDDLIDIFGNMPPMMPVVTKENTKAHIDLEDFFGGAVEAQVVDAQEDMIQFDEIEKEMIILEETEEMDKEHMEESSISTPSSQLDASTTRALLTFPSKPPPSAVCHMLGASVNDMEGPAVRCRYDNFENGGWIDDYNHIVMTVAEQMAREAEKKEAKAKLKEDKTLAEKVSRELEKMDKEEEEEDKATGKQKKNKKISPSAALSVLEPPEPSVRVIGVYDSVFDIFTQLLQENEERKKILLARKQPKKVIQEEEEDFNENEFWFRRKSARVLPTVLVAELLTDRTEDEVCVDYHVNQLKKTLVLRNKGKPPQEADRANRPRFVAP